MSSQHSSADFTNDQSAEKNTIVQLTESPRQDDGDDDDDNAYELPDDKTSPSVSESSSSAIIDIDVLCARLEEYKARIEEAEAARLRRLQNNNINNTDTKNLSLSPKEAADVAAAARFRLEIDRRATAKKKKESSSTTTTITTTTATTSTQGSDRRSGSTTSTSAGVAPSASSTTSTTATSRRPTQEDVNILDDSSGVGDARRKSNRIKHSPEPSVHNTASGATSEERTKPQFPSRTSSMKKIIPSLRAIKLHHTSIPMPESPRSMSSTAVSTPSQSTFPPAVPTSSSVVSVVTVESRKTSQTSNQLSMWQPNEDQIRREMEVVAMQEGPNLREHVPRDAGDRKPASAVQITELEDEGVDDTGGEVKHRGTDNHNNESPKTRKDEYGKTTLREKMAFFNPLHRRLTTDKFIELYMDADQLLEFKNPKRKTRKLSLFR